MPYFMLLAYRLLFFRLKYLYCLWLVCFTISELHPQHYEAKSILYNTLIGGISGGIGAVIHKNKNEKNIRSFARGFITGSGGGLLMYAGKKMNMLIAQKKNISCAWLSRAVFSAGNSIVENAAAGSLWYARWHYDLGFIRFEFRPKNKENFFFPKLMPSALGSFIFTALNGRLDAVNSLKSGVFIFKTSRIAYAPYLIGSTTGNNVLFTDTLYQNASFHEVFAHEMVHTCQFQEMSGFNYFFDPLSTKWKKNSPGFNRLSKYVYGDLNYELMLINYFFVHGGIKRSLYCRNFLENEAEFLSTGRTSCPPTPDHR